jgi:hypothetical protein
MTETGINQGHSVLALTSSVDELVRSGILGDYSCDVGDTSVCRVNASHMCDGKGKHSDALLHNLNAGRAVKNVVGW